jgi:hypothetical protein
MSDIVERLRDYIKRGLLKQPIVEEAADEIERLQALLQEIAERSEVDVVAIRRALEGK